MPCHRPKGKREPNRRRKYRRKKEEEAKREQLQLLQLIFRNENETNEKYPHTHPPESPKNEDGNKNSTSFEHTTQAPETVWKRTQYIALNRRHRCRWCYCCCCCTRTHHRIHTENLKSFLSRSRFFRSSRASKHQNHIDSIVVVQIGGLFVLCKVTTKYEIFT